VTETGLEPSPLLTAIEREVIAYANASAIEPDFTGATPRWTAAAAVALTNLPVRPTTLIGRDNDIAHVRELLGRYHLVTVTAVGGSGKTRLAIAVREAELAHRPHGVWFVDLTAISSDDEMLGAIAGAVGLSLATGDASAQLIGFFADNEAVIILDNCEHVIDSCAMFAERFLASHGSTVLLATSRELLDIEGEHVVMLPPLRCDGLDSPGVQLFLDRALAINPRFQLTQADAQTLTICTRLDGLPLAIELAAARVTVMNPAELLAGLDDRFELLSHGRRGHRHRALEATLDWSYELLTPEEQRVLRALGVFTDGFDADEVGAVTCTARARALAVIEALTAKSLVDRADHDGEVRFRLFESVKAYAEDRLVDAGETAEVRDRHFDHFHRVATVHGRIIAGEIRVGLRLRADLSNITSAFEWAAAAGRWTRAGELLQGASSVFDIELAWLDGLPLLERAIQACTPLDVDLAERMKALRLEWLMLTQDPRLADCLKDLLNSPVPVVRAHVRAHAAFIVSFGAPSTDSLVAWAHAALNRLAAEDSGPVSAVAIDAHLLMARVLEAVVHGDFAAGLAHFEGITREDRYAPMTHANAAFATATAVFSWPPSTSPRARSNEPRPVRQAKQQLRSHGMDPLRSPRPSTRSGRATPTAHQRVVRSQRAATSRRPQPEHEHPASRNGRTRLDLSETALSAQRILRPKDVLCTEMIPGCAPPRQSGTTETHGDAIPAPWCRPPRAHHALDVVFDLTP
jgi:predicted ATPase